MPCFLVLDGVTDPHNLGACLRTADAAGVQALILPKDRSASVDGVARKVAAGAAEFVPVAAVTNLARALGRLKESGIWVVGTDGEAEQTLYAADLNRPLALVLGAEGEGMRRLTRESLRFPGADPHGGAGRIAQCVGGGGHRAVRGRRQRPARLRRSPAFDRKRPKRVSFALFFRRPAGFTPCLTARNGRLIP